MKKQEQALIIETIENIYNEKINKLTEDKQKALDNAKILKEKCLITEKENKEYKAKIKALEKELNISKKTNEKYEKLLENFKK